jgi:hypothetical protein
MKRNWTKEEDSLLIKSYEDGIVIEKIAELLKDRNYSAIVHRAHRLKITKIQWRGPRLGQLDIRSFSEGELGYLAGFIDADGNIGLHKTQKKYNQPVVQFSNNDERVVRWLCDKLHVNPVKNKPRWSHNKPVYMVRLYRIKDIYELLKALLPLLKIKMREAEIVIKYCEQRINNTGKKISEVESNLQRSYTVFADASLSRRRGANNKKI